jgi:hypothetical protein
LSALLDRTIAEDLSPDLIKRAVTNWRSDVYRT